MTLLRCPHCDALAVGRPHPLWPLAQVCAWGYAFVSVLGASLVGPFIVGLVPLLLFGGVCLISETHRRAGAPASCRACGRDVAGLRPQPLPRASVIDGVQRVV